MFVTILILLVVLIAIFYFIRYVVKDDRKKYGKASGSRAGGGHRSRTES